MAMNVVDITVKVDGDGAIREIRRLEKTTDDSTTRQKTAWDRITGVLPQVGQAFGGLGKVVAGSGVLAMASPLGAIGLAMGGFAAVAIPSLSKVADYFHKTGTAAQTAWKNMDPEQRNLARSIGVLKTSFDQLEQKMAPVVATVANLAVKTGQALLPSLGQLARTGGKVIGDFLTPLKNLFASDFFHGFIASMSRLAEQVAPALGRQFAQLLKAVLQLVEKLGPAGAEIAKSIIPALIDIVKALTPVITWIAKLLAAMLKTKAGAAILAGALTALGVAWLFGFGPVGWAIGLLAGLVVAFKVAWDHSQTFRNVVSKAVSVVGGTILREGIVIVNILHGIADTFLTVMGTIIHVAAMIPGPWQSTFRKIDAGFQNYKDTVDSIFNHVHDTLEQWRTNLDRLPKIVKLQGNITDLQNKLATARHNLADPNLTKTRRAHIQANIDQLQAALRRARADLASLHNKDVYITTHYTATGTGYGGGHPLNAATGGIIGARQPGGPWSGLTMVGEHGRELVRLPPGSQVWSNPDTERMITQGGGGGGPAVIRIEAGNSELDRLLLRVLQRIIRTDYQGNVILAFGGA